MCFIFCKLVDYTASANTDSAYKKQLILLHLNRRFIEVV